MSTAKKTGGGSAEVELTEFEMKIKSIEGRETFEGITSGLDVFVMSSNSPHDDIEMLSSPVAATFQTCSSQATGLELVEPGFYDPRKRKLSDPGTDSVKKNILENQVKKVEILEAIESKMVC